jgi:hypothetical protein
MNKKEVDEREWLAPFLKSILGPLYPRLFVTPPPAPKKGQNIKPLEKNRDVLLTLKLSKEEFEQEKKRVLMAANILITKPDAQDRLATLEKGEEANRFIAEFIPWIRRINLNLLYSYRVVHGVIFTVMFPSIVSAVLNPGAALDKSLDAAFKTMNAIGQIALSVFFGLRAVGDLFKFGSKAFQTWQSYQLRAATMRKKDPSRVGSVNNDEEEFEGTYRYNSKGEKITVRKLIRTGIFVGLDAAISSFRVAALFIFSATFSSTPLGVGMLIAMNVIFEFMATAKSITGYLGTRARFISEAVEQQIKKPGSALKETKNPLIKLARILVPSAFGLKINFSTAQKTQLNNQGKKIVERALFATAWTGLATLTIVGLSALLPFFILTPPLALAVGTLGGLALVCVGLARRWYVEHQKNADKLLEKKIKAATTTPDSTQRVVAGLQQAEAAKDLPRMDYPPQVGVGELKAIPPRVDVVVPIQSRVSTHPRSRSSSRVSDDSTQAMKPSASQASFFAAETPPAKEHESTKRRPESSPPLPTPPPESSPPPPTLSPKLVSRVPSAATNLHKRMKDEHKAEGRLVMVGGPGTIN